jgi:hypothetical protein
MQISSSGAITTTGVISGSNALSASYAATASFVTLSQTASFVANAQSASNAVTAQTASFANTFTVAGTLTAQTLVVQTITSSVDYVTGSTRFGSTGSNTHQFTGSILSNGAIGIGTSSPTSGYSLDVNGTSYFRSTTVITGSGGTYLNIRNSGGSDSAVLVFDGTNTGYVGLNVGSNSNKFVIYYAADTRMVIDTSGSVGFGTVSPGYNLEISSGSASPTELAITNTNASGAARLSLRNAERNFIVTSNTTDDLLSFSYDGSNRLQFNLTNQWFNSGNVGIGTTSPSTFLHVLGSNTSNRGQLCIQSNNASNAARASWYYDTTLQGNIGTTSGDFYAEAINNFLLLAGGSTRLTISSTGTAIFASSVGVGNVTPYSILSLPSGTGWNGGLSWNYTTANSSSKRWWINTDQIVYGDFRICTEINQGGGSINNAATLYERFYIGPTGNIGIGTTSPLSKLYVAGTAGDVTSDTGNGTIVEVYGGNITTTNHGVGVGFTREGSQLGYIKTARENNTNEASFMIFSTQTSAGAHPERMRITSTGRVGIGVTNPDAGLQVAQPGQDDQLTIGSAANNRDHAAFIYSGGNKAEFLRYQSSIRLVIGSSGNISYVDVVPGGSVGVRLNAGNTSWSAYTSDERKKKNFETVPGLEAVMQINPVKYHFKTQEDSETKKLGFIAQNIQPLIPEMVHTNGEKAEDGTDILTIIPDYMLPVLVKAIQEQQAQIEELKAKING